jgi:hypothetical protein
MISNKLSQLEPALNDTLNITDLIIQNKNFSSQKIEDNLTSRNIDEDGSSISGSSSMSFNYISDDFYENVFKIHEDAYDIFKKLLLCCTNYSSSEDQEDIDVLINEINKEIFNFNKEIQEIRIKKTIHLANFPTEVIDETGNKKIYEFSSEDAKLIDRINRFLDKYKEYNSTF